jgi:hypothetical protein
VAVVVVVIVVVGGWLFRPSRHGPPASTGSAQPKASSGYTRFALPQSTRRTPADEQMANVDPRRDGWQSEVVSAAIDRQLGRIREGIESASSAELAGMATDDFSGELVEAESFRPILVDRFCRVDRLPDDGAPQRRTNSLTAAVDSWRGPTSGPGLRCSFKIIDIDVNAEASEATTRLLVELVQRADDAMLQLNAVCQARWRLTADETPRLAWLAVQSCERVRLTAERGPLFEEGTDAVLGATDSYRDQVLRGIGHWCQRLTGLDDMHIYGHHGVAVGDVNKDGLDDLYVCDSGGLPNRLYLQQPDGTVRDESRDSGADWLESSTGALLVDLDNDGDQDLVVATVAAIVLAANDSQGHFRIRDARPGMPEAHSLSAADYDNDGDLDLYVTNYGPGGSTIGTRGFEASLPIPYHDAQNGGRNVLLENQGGWKFADVTERCGLEMNNRRWSFAASWEDFDADGDMDLYVANDFGRNNLYRNDRGKFEDVAAQLGVEDMAAGMSVSWADFNHDGRPDIYVGNMFSAAGNRVAYQRRFVEGRSALESAGIQRMARGNTLFMAQPDGTFADVSLSAGVTMGRWAWSSKFADLNNDGWDDLIVANGYFTNEKADDL